MESNLLEFLYISENAICFTIILKIIHFLLDYSSYNQISYYEISSETVENKQI